MRLGSEEPLGPQDIAMTRNKQFYVYLIRDPRPDKHGVPIYVGKGNGSRAKKHWRAGAEHSNPLLARVFAKCRRLDLVPLVEIVRYFEAEADAFLFEVELIAQYGRRDLGVGGLCNLTDGGEGQSGNLASAERARKLSADIDLVKLRNERIRQRHAEPEFRKAHAERGRELMRQHNSDPDYLARIVEGQRRRDANPEIVAARNERLRRLNNDLDFARARNERSREHLRKLHADPVFAQAHVERMRAMHADPKFAEANAKRASEHMRKLNADPEFAQARDERMRKMHADRARARLTVEEIKPS
jgi:hypothetical protein